MLSQVVLQAYSKNSGLFVIVKKGKNDIIHTGYIALWCMCFPEFNITYYVIPALWNIETC